MILQRLKLGFERYISLTLINGLSLLAVQASADFAPLHWGRIVVLVKVTMFPKFIPLSWPSQSHSWLVRTIERHLCLGGEQLIILRKESQINSGTVWICLTSLKEQCIIRCKMFNRTCTHIGTVHCIVASCINSLLNLYQLTRNRQAYAVYAV